MRRGGPPGLITILAIWLTVLTWPASAQALELWVDASGGSLALEEVASAALEDWRAAGADPDAVDTTVRLAYGDAARFGDDVLSWLLLRPEGLVGVGSAGDPAAPGPGYEIQLHPGLEPTRAALIPAFGVILGGTFGQGALDPYVDPEQPRLPTPVEAQALRDQRSAVPGDLNRDGVVDFEDLLLLAAEYGQRGLNLPSDLDRDGVVGDGDLDLLRAAYTFTGPASPAAAPDEQDDQANELPQLPPGEPVEPDDPPEGDDPDSEEPGDGTPEDDEDDAEEEDGSADDG